MSSEIGTHEEEAARRAIHQHLNPAIEALIVEMRADTIRWFGEEVHDNPGIQILGLVGESGEVADCYKKYLRGSKDLAATKVHMAEELIDVFYYWVHLVELVGVDVFKEYIRKRDKNEGRFAKHD